MSLADKDAESNILPPWMVTTLIGHQRAIDEFTAAFEAGRLAHAWLITGAKGVGKATLAYHLARYVLVSSVGKESGEQSLFGGGDARLDALSSPENTIFRQVANRAHPDLRVFECRWNEKTKRMQSEISIEDIRELTEFTRLTPSRDGWRVIVIDAMDDLNRNAANALLKSLEEPRPRTVFLLICHRPALLLPTIRSRCRHLALLPLSNDDIITALSGQVAESDLPLILNLANGSLGRAREWGIEENLALFRDLWFCLGEWPEFDPGTLHRLGDVFLDKGNRDQFLFMQEFLMWWWYRFTRYASGQPLAPLMPDEGKLAKGWLAVADLDQWMKVWEKVRQILIRVDWANADRKQTWLNVMLSIAAQGRSR